MCVAGRVGRYHLDLTGATLENFRLEGWRIDRLTARQARFHGITALGGLHATKPVPLTSAAFYGRVDLRDAQLAGGISLRDTTFVGEVAVAGATIGTFLDLHTSPPAGLIDTLTVAEGTRVYGDPEPWAAAPVP